MGDWALWCVSTITDEAQSSMLIRLELTGSLFAVTSYCVSLLPLLAALRWPERRPSCLIHLWELMTSLLCHASVCHAPSRSLELSFPPSTTTSSPGWLSRASSIDKKKTGLQPVKNSIFSEKNAQIFFKYILKISTLLPFFPPYLKGHFYFKKMKFSYDIFTEISYPWQKERKNGRKDGMKEGRKDRRTDGRKEGREWKKERKMPLFKEKVCLVGQKYIFLGFLPAPPQYRSLMLYQLVTLASWLLVSQELNRSSSQLLSLFL